MKEQLKKIHAQLKAFQNKLDKGVPISIKVGKKKLDLLIKDVWVDGDNESAPYIYYGDSTLQPNCEVSIWVEKYFSDDFFEYANDQAISRALNNKENRAFLKKIQKTSEDANINIREFIYHFHFDENFENFYKRYSKHMEPPQVKKQSVEFKGVTFTKDEIIELARKFDK